MSGCRELIPTPDSAYRCQFTLSKTITSHHKYPPPLHPSLNQSNDMAHRSSVSGINKPYPLWLGPLDSELRACGKAACQDAIQVHASDLRLLDQGRPPAPSRVEAGRRLESSPLGKAMRRAGNSQVRPVRIHLTVELSGIEFHPISCWNGFCHHNVNIKHGLAAEGVAQVYCNL